MRGSWENNTREERKRRSVFRDKKWNGRGDKIKKKCNQSKHFRVQKQLLSCCVLIPTRGKHSDSGHVFKDDNTQVSPLVFFRKVSEISSCRQWLCYFLMFQLSPVIIQYTRNMMGAVQPLLSRHNDGLWPNQTARRSARSAERKPEAEVFINMYGILHIVKGRAELQISIINSDIHNSAEIHFKRGLPHEMQNVTK